MIGAQVFRYYPYVAGEYLPAGHRTAADHRRSGAGGAAPVGDSLLGDALLALEQLVDMVDDHSDRPAPAAQARSCG